MSAILSFDKSMQQKAVETVVAHNGMNYRVPSFCKRRARDSAIHPPQGAVPLKAVSVL